MRERPILFSDSMVRAIRGGRKTQTRRPVRPQPTRVARHEEPLGWGHRQTITVPDGWQWRDLYTADHPEGGNRPTFAENLVACGGTPYGAPGDRLWVREAWGLWDTEPSDGAERATIFYRATQADEHELRYQRWRPSIHMPRWASRILLEVVSVRAERVQEISDADVTAEGFGRWTKDGDLWKWGLAERHVSGELDLVEPWSELSRSAQDAFGKVWDSIYAARELSWATNPWVWVCEFKVIG